MQVADQQMMRNPMAIPSFETAIPLVISFAPNWPVRKVLFQLIGVALILSAAGLWLMPGAQNGAEFVLIKLGVSVLFLLVGLGLLSRNDNRNQPDVFFDPIRNELRVLQKDNRGRPQTVLRRGYETLGSARFGDKTVEMYNVDGSLLMRLAIADPEVRNALRSQLSGMVNVTS